jgi:polysaccharide pyruvyl transferase WcaK-like protein
MHNLSRRRPGVEFVGVSLDARDTARSLGIGAFPISGVGPKAPRPELHASYTSRSVSHWPSYRLRRLVQRLTRIALQPVAVARIGRFLGSVDVLIVSGGGQLDDFYGGAWAHPYLLVLWIALARLRGIRVAFLGVGLERLDSPLSRTFVLNALRLAHYRSFRDSGTLDGLRKIGWRGQASVCPDPAFSLSIYPAHVDPASGPFAVISPITEHTWSVGNDPRHASYLNQLVAAGVWLHERAIGIRIVCSQFVADKPTAERLREMLRDQGVVHVELSEAPTVAQFLGYVREATMVIASRLHAAILSLVAGAPVIALAPVRKVSQLMQDAGMRDYCVELQRVSSESLLPRMASVLQHQGELRCQVREYVEQSRFALIRTYDDIGRLIDEAHR